MTSPGQDGSRADQPVGRPGPRWDADPGGPSTGEPSTGEPRTPSAGSRPPTGPREKAPRVLPEDATLGRRLGAWLIDELARTLFYPLLLLVFVMIGGSLPAPTSPGELTLGAVMPQMVLRFGLSWIFWSQGTSPGAMLLNLRLVDAQGNPPGPARGGVRAAVEILSVSTLLLGFAWALFSHRRQTWHDKAAGVYVVNAPPEGATSTERMP